MHSLSVGQVTRQISPVLQHDRASKIPPWKWPARLARVSLVVVAELALAAISYTLAVCLLAEARGAVWATGVLGQTLGLLVLFRLAALVSVRLYRRSLRHASVADLLAIAKAASASSLLFWGFVSWQFAQLKVPFAVFAVDWAFLQLLWGGLHFGSRVIETQQAVWRTDGKRVVIVGAGDAGISLLKELALDSASTCLPVAVVDDDPEKWGRTIHGVPVVGGVACLAKLAANVGAEEILVCIPSATPAQMRAILAATRDTAIPVRTLPSLAELVDGKASSRDLRRPRIEDLLQREEMRVDVEATRKIVGGKVVLVTGAGGSIGSELCHQIAAAGPRKLLLLDKSENGLFYANLEACERLGPARVRPLLVDLVYGHRLREIMRSERPEIIFHAAAHKHVGLLELHPYEAIRNNVIGTRNLAEAARECGAARFVNISTDKAVNPRNYMGLSKKLTELCIQELARITATRLVNVRFGNVAGSTGSVLRLFWEQIQKGAPICVTDPRATRYFMSVPEAVHLILRAAALGRGGETFVFEMGEPVNIYELAKTMALFAGLRPEQDLSIEFTGLADGEKISEQLWEEWERPIRTESGRILVLNEPDPRSRGILEKIRDMEGFILRDDREGLLKYLQEVAPNFNCQRNLRGAAVIPPPASENPNVASVGGA
jgi:FlaA1/EpsC-like NDP-sugar epimerase